MTSLRNRRVVVVGSLVMDCHFSIPTMPRAGETRIADSLKWLAGGKGANQAVMAAQAGCSVEIYGAVGADAIGDLLIAECQRAGVDVSGILRLPESTGTAAVLVEPSGENRIVLALGANLAFKAADLALDFAEAHAVVLQNEVAASVNQSVVSAAQRLEIPVVYNAAPFRPKDMPTLQERDWLIVNAREAADLLSLDEPRKDSAAHLAANLGCSVVVTLGAEGCAWANPSGESGFAAGFPVDAISTVGAGDAFVGALVSTIVQSPTQEPDLNWAQAAAALSTLEVGTLTAMPRSEAVDVFLSRQNTATPTRKVRETRPSVHLQVEAGPKVGLGHWHRSLALAQQMHKLGCRVSIDTQLLDHSLSLPDYVNENSPDAPDIRVVDGHDLVLSPAGPFVVLIDDHGGARSHAADLILNQNGFAEQVEYPDTIPTLRGPRFALLRDEWLQHRVISRPQGPPTIIFGGSDPLRLSQQAIEQLGPDAPPCRLILGPLAEQPQQVPKSIEVLRAPPLAQTLAQASVVLTSAGTTVYELACLGVPQVALEIVPNQTGMAQWVNESGVGVGIARSDPPDLAGGLATLIQLAEDAERRELMHANGQRAVDGQGAERAAKAILEAYLRSQA